MEEYNMDLKIIMEKINQGTVGLTELGIEVKEYLPISTKEIIINSLLDECLTYNVDNGTIECDYLLREIVLELMFLFQYTNIEINEEDEINSFDVYDLFQKHGILEQIFMKIPHKEQYFISDILDRQIEQRLKFENSMEGIISKGIDMLVGIIDRNSNPKEIQKIIRTIGKEAQKIGVNGEAVNGFLSGLVSGGEEKTEDVNSKIKKPTKLVN